MNRKPLVSVISLAACMLIAGAARGEVTVKIKDITTYDGMKTNHVFGYGLVVGLQGTGDSRTSLAKSSLQNMLNNLGIEAEMISSNNCAAVLMTAELPPYAHSGDRVTVSVSSIGDAKSLAGGTLVQSPLKGADDVIYVVAQGPVSISGQARGRGAIKTAGIVTRGGLVERDIRPDVITDGKIKLILNTWNYSLAHNIIKAVKEKFPESKPSLDGDGKISIAVVRDLTIDEYMMSLGEIEVTAAQKPVIVIHEKDGTIATGGTIRISQAMVSRQGLTVEIRESARQGSAAMIQDTTSVSDLVETLNSIGASTDDIVAILKALKDAGSLHAELIVR